MSVATAADMYDLSDYLIRDAINRGVLPAHRISERNIRIHTDDLDAWFKSHQRVVEA